MSHQWVILSYGELMDETNSMGDSEIMYTAGIVLRYDPRFRNPRTFDQL